MKARMGGTACYGNDCCDDEVEGEARSPKDDGCRRSPQPHPPHRTCRPQPLGSFSKREQGRIDGCSCGETSGGSVTAAEAHTREADPSHHGGAERLLPSTGEDRQIVELVAGQPCRHSHTLHFALSTTPTLIPS